MRDKVRERYYAHRAPVYDATSYRGDPEVDAGLDRETAEISALLPQALTARSTMLDIARTRVPDARLVLAGFPPLPFPDASFDTLFTANFYGLLRPDERAAFLAEARRVARELVVLDLRSD